MSSASADGCGLVSNSSDLITPLSPLFSGAYWIDYVSNISSSWEGIGNEQEREQEHQWLRCG